MALALTVGNITDELGAPSFVHAFFSTISKNCEPLGWGTRFPRLMNELYQGKLPSGQAGAALAELRAAKAILTQLPLSGVVWDIDDPSAMPPWGENIAPSITSLGNYFISSTGRDVFGILEEALDYAAANRREATIA